MTGSDHLLPPHPHVVLIREGKHQEFNRLRSNGTEMQLRGADLGAANLRLFAVEGLDLSNANLRQADLRGLDLRLSRLEGALIIGARIEGTYFPLELSADEIRLSHSHGTRLRYANPTAQS